MLIWEHEKALGLRLSHPNRINVPLFWSYETHEPYEMVCKSKREEDGPKPAGRPHKTLTDAEAEAMIE